MCNRHLKDAGIHPLVAYVLLTALFLGLSVYLFQSTEFAPYIYLLVALSLIGNLSEKRRTEFLSLCFGDSRMKKIRICENVMASVPFLAFLLYQQLFVYMALLVVLVILMALSHFKTVLPWTMWTPFSKRPFEFTVGFRNTFYLFILAYGLAVMAVIQNNFNLGIFALLIVFATCLFYHTKAENEYYVWSFHLKPRAFLLRKIKTALLYSSLLALPIALLLCYFFYQNIGIILLFMVLAWAFLISMIVSKYSEYPNEIYLAPSILLALCLWFPPLLLIFIPYYFKKSENRLSRLLK
ncbi:ABC transporter permease [Aquirufa ecclesiirivi]|uniref:ABC transporter permease n=1 Tax=Aquirufa ecclesiirivi TaxID=2715124 RepID=UPI003BAEAFC6